MKAPLFVLFFICAVSQNGSAEPVSALTALKALPPGEARKLACIEGREGAPGPDRWYFIVHDPTAENALREYVVEGRRVVALRTVSQFSDGVKPDDVFAAEPIAVDSNRACAIARQFAEADNVAVARFNYQLKRDGSGTAPVWKITCLDEAGEKIGTIAILASTGRAVANSGFARTPAGSTPSGTDKKSTETLIAGQNPEAPALGKEDARAAAERGRRTEAPASQGTPSTRHGEPVGEKRRTPIESFGHGLGRLFGGGH